MQTGVDKKPFDLVDNCPKPELISVKCPMPRCGRKAPTLQDASQKATAKSAPASINNLLSEVLQRSRPIPSDIKSWSFLDDVNNSNIQSGITKKFYFVYFMFNSNF